MAVEEYKDRQSKVLRWVSDYEGPVTLRTTNPETGDVSESKFESNPGFGAVTFPLDYSGTYDAQVLDADGNVLDEGSGLEV